MTSQNQEMPPFDPEKLGLKLAELPIELPSETPPQYNAGYLRPAQAVFMDQFRRLNPINKLPKPPTSMERSGRDPYSKTVSNRILKAGRTTLQLHAKTTFYDGSSFLTQNAEWWYERVSKMALSFPPQDKEGLEVIVLQDEAQEKFSIRKDSPTALEERLAQNPGLPAGHIEIAYPNKGFEGFGIHFSDESDRDIRKKADLRGPNLVRSLAVAAAILEKVDPSQLKLVELS